MRFGKCGGGYFAGAVLVVAAVAGAGATDAAEQTWPAHVTSVYKLSFNGFEVGSFAFESSTAGGAYKATSTANVSALFGAFKWKGSTAASGDVSNSGPRPVSYQLNFRTKSKAGVVKLGFDQGSVKSYSVEPKKAPSAEAVPIKQDQLKNVLDPMGAVIALSQGGSKDPCAKKIPVFDGKARFDLVLSYKGRQKITEKTADGQPSELVVCKVKYQPVAGHKPKDFEKPWVDYAGIEIAFRPVPSANLYVPYSIVVPTTIGSAVMSAEKIDITTPSQTTIALRR